MPIVGTQQSPIEIREVDSWHVKVADDFFYPSYSGTPLAGHLDQDNFILTEFESIKVDKSDWTLRRIHFHREPEHKIEGRPESHFEVHLVHTLGKTPKADPDLSKDKLVIAVLFKVKAKAKAREAFQILGKGIEKGARNAEGKLETIHGLKINPMHFLPDEEYRPFWFRYEGSLTSGSFSEDVSWYVYKHETDIPKADYDKLKKQANQHARERFGVNRRFVLRSFE